MTMRPVISISFTGPVTDDPDEVASFVEYVNHIAQLTNGFTPYTVEVYTEDSGLTTVPLDELNAGPAMGHAELRKALRDVMRYYPTSQDAFPVYAKLARLRE
jgi:hypothetical protein